MSDAIPQAALEAVRTAEAWRPKEVAVPKFADNQTVYIKRDGKLSAVSGADANTLFSGSAAATTELATQDEFAKQQVAKSFDGTGRGLAAAAIGAGSIGGILPTVVRNLDPATANAWNQYREERPGAYTAGEVGGLLATALIPGGQAEAGAGLAARLGLGGARALAAPVRGVSALGTATEGLAARVLGEGALARVASTAAGQAVEGGLYGLGNAVTDAALKGDELTTEKVLAGIGHGAIIGAGAGAALKTVGEVGGGLLSRAGKASREVDTAVNSGLTKETAESLALATPKADTTLGAITNSIERDATFRAIGIRGENAILMQKNQELANRVLTTAHEELPAFAGKKRFDGLMSKTDMAEAAPKLSEAKGERVGANYDWLDKKVAESPLKVGNEIIHKDGIDVQKVFNKLSELETAALPSVGGVERAGMIAAVRQDLERVVALRGEPTFKMMHELRGQVDDTIKKHNFPTTVRDEIRKDIRWAIEDEMLSQAETLAKTHGDADFVARFKADKEGYRAAKIIEESVTEQLKRQQSNRFGGLSEQLGLLGGLATAGLSGGLVGFAIQRLAKDRGAQFVADIARRAGGDRRLSAVTHLVDDRAVKAVDAFAGEKTAKAALRAEPVVSRKDLTAQYTRMADAVRRTVKNPAGIANAVADIRQANPAIADSLAAKAQTATAFLDSKLPQERSRSPLQPKVAPNKPSPADMSKFVRYAKAVDDPLSVFEDASKGKVSREGVEALKAVYPALYSELQGRYGAAIANRSKELSYAQKVQMAVLFDLPADASFIKVNIQAVQKALTPAPAPQQPGPQTGTYKSSVASSRSRELGAFSERMKGEE